MFVSYEVNKIINVNQYLLATIKVLKVFLGVRLEQISVEYQLLRINFVYNGVLDFYQVVNLSRLPNSVNLTAATEAKCSL